jgi:hypothetical protein
MHSLTTLTLPNSAPGLSPLSPMAQKGATRSTSFPEERQQLYVIVSFVIDIRLPWAHYGSPIKVAGIKDAVGGYSSRAGRLWPYKLVTQLLRRVVSAGANLQTHTPVLSVSERPDVDGRWTVTTPRGTIRSKWVVFASNAYTSAIAPEYKGTVVPVRGTCSHITVPKPPANPLRSSYTFRFNTWDYDYLIPRPDGSVVVGGGKSTYMDDQGNWYDNTDDSRLIDAAARYFDDYMQRHFHGWDRTGACADQVWTGSTYQQPCPHRFEANQRQSWVIRPTGFPMLGTFRTSRDNW